MVREWFGVGIGGLYAFEGGLCSEAGFGIVLAADRRYGKTY